MHFYTPVIYLEIVRATAVENVQHILSEKFTKFTSVYVTVKVHGFKMLKNAVNKVG